MGWDQSFSVPSVESLLETLTGFSAFEVLEEELKCQGILINKTEEVLLDSDMCGDVKGLRVFLSDGRVFEPKLVRRETAFGNSGNDVYEYKLKDEEVKVENVDLTDMGEDNGIGLCTTDCGCIDHPLDDLELESENGGC